MDHSEPNILEANHDVLADAAAMQRKLTARFLEAPDVGELLTKTAAANDE
jgi:hypothetical protein